MTDWVPLRNLMMPGKGETSSAQWYLRGGGLQRRLLVLGQAARALSRLHAQGLALADPSPDSILVPRSGDPREARLIDTGGHLCESDHRTTECTPGRAAPELLNRTSGVTTLTNAFSFAVLAFQTLTLAHPFAGEVTHVGASGLGEGAHGEKPRWTGDNGDEGREAASGIPRTWVLSRRLTDAFRMAFGRGRREPAMRPGVGEWSSVLLRAADATLQCPACSGTFYCTNARCPWCGRDRPGYAMALFHLWDPDCGEEGGIVESYTGDAARPVLVDRGVLSDGQTFVITRRLAFGLTNGSSSEPVVSVKLSRAGVRLRSLDGKVHTLLSAAGDRKTGLGALGKTVPMEEGHGSWRLHFGPGDVLHRVASFGRRAGTDA